MQKNYIAYSSEFCEYEEFDTFEEAEAWLKETVDDAFVPWLASQTDILAEDWGIVE